MRIGIGYDMAYRFAEPTPMVLMLRVHDSRSSDLETPDLIVTEPGVQVTEYHDSFGNRCSELIAPAGLITLSSRGVIRDPGNFEVPVTDAVQHPVSELPTDAIQFLLASRYCETDMLSQTAWNLFAHTRPGYQRVQAICDYVHNLLDFSYANARSTRTAADAFNERSGVCRDFTHLAMTFCRAMNIPTRYCTGYLGDMGLPPPYSPMDFAAWFEAYIGGQWHTFDPRNNTPRIGRVVIARGRDAADVAIATTFGPHCLERFIVYTDELSASLPPVVVAA